MGINSGGINKSQTVTTELTVINGATIDSTTLVIDDGNDRVGIGDSDPGTVLQITGTEPYLTLKNSTSENVAGGCESKLIFEDHGNNSLGLIEVSHVGSSDDEKGQMILKTNNDSGLQTALTISEAQATTFSGAVTVGVDDAGHDVKFFGDTASAYMLWDTSEDDLILGGAAGLDVDGITNLDAVDIDGAVQLDNTLTVGVDDQGYDVKFFGDTASAYMLWDTSEDDLILGGAARMVIPDGQLVLASTAVTSTAAELNVLDGLNRGHIVVGNASGVPTSLGEGSEDQVLTIDSNGDAVWATSTSSGASELNGLSDVSYSSGDLTITSLDLLTTSASAHDAAGTAIVIRGGTTTAGTTNNIAGGDLTLLGGAGKGSGAGGAINFQVVPAGGSGSVINTTLSTQMIVNESGIRVNAPFNPGGVADFKIESEDSQHMFIVDADQNRIGIGYDNDGVPNATLNIKNNNDNSGGNVPLLLLQNDNVDVIALDIDAANTTANVIDLVAGSMTTATALRMQLDGLETGKGIELTCNRGHSGSKTLIHAENQHNSAINTTLLHLKNSANQNVAPHALLEYAGDQTDHPPILEFRRSDNGTEADDMELGQLDFVGCDSGNTLTTFAQIATQAQDVTDGTEDGLIEFKTQVAGTLTTQLKIDKGGVSFPTGLVTPVTVTTAAIALDETHNGSHILIMELGANRIYTLPAKVANYCVEFVFAQNNLTYSIEIRTNHADDRMIGLFCRFDHQAESEHGYDTGTFSGANSTTLHGSGAIGEQNHNKVTIDDVVQGSVAKFYCDGTRWYCWGHMVSSETGADVECIMGLYS
jgi:hypothetical protein